MICNAVNRAEIMVRITPKSQSVRPLSPATKARPARLKNAAAATAGRGMTLKNRED